MPAPLLAALLVAGGAIAGYEWLKHRKAAVVDDGRVLPAYPGLVKASPAQRRAALDAAAAVGASPAALAAVIQSESQWDPTEPHEKTGTPRAGLNQITEGAFLPGFDTADKVWAVRGWSMERQLRDVVVPFLRRFTARADWPDLASTPLGLYKLNFLPALAHESDDYHLGEEGSTEVIPGGLTKGKVYAANPGFDPEKKGYFTWADVAKRVAKIQEEAHGQVVTIPGAVRPAQPGEV